MKRFLCILILCALGLSACAAEPVRSAEETAALKKCFSLCGVYSGYVAVCRDYSGKPTHLIDETGEIVLTFSDWEEVGRHGSPDAIPVKKDGKWELVNGDGEPVAVVESTREPVFCDPSILERYDSVDFRFAQSGFYAVCLDEKWGFVTTDGEQTVPCIYDFVRAYRDGLAIVFLDGLYGIIDETGAAVLSCEYDFIVRIADGLYWCYKWCYSTGDTQISGALFGASGEFLTPFGQMRAYNNYGHSDLVVVWMGEQSGVFSRTGEWVVPLQDEWDLLDGFVSGFCIYAEELPDGGIAFGFINERGEVVFPAVRKEDFSYRRCNQHLYILRGEELSIYDLDGNPVF